MPKRRGIWLDEYQEIKYRTAFQWFAESVFGGLALIGGGTLVFLTWTSERVESQGLVLGSVAAFALITYGFLKLPGGIIYLIRRKKGEPVDVWDYETPDDPSVQQRRHKN